MAGIGPPPDGSGGPHVFVESLEAPVLLDDDEHHLRRVLRVRDGDVITLSDGDGRWRPAVLGGAVDPTGEIVTVKAPEPQIMVGFVVPKGDRPNWIVQKLTELGVDRIQPLSSVRSVVRWEGERGERHLQRLRSVARSAAMQSRQVRIPVVEPLSEVTAAQADGGAVLAHRDGIAPTLAHPAVFVGPEGGWDGTELSPEAVCIGLGPSVLRAETAAIVAGATLSLLRSRLVFEHSA